LVSFIKKHYAREWVELDV
jgi:protein disulfide-isomerase-like protein